MIYRCASQWDGKYPEQFLVWYINVNRITDRALRGWVYRNCGEYMDVLRHCWVKAFADMHEDLRYPEGTA